MSCYNQMHLLYIYADSILYNKMLGLLDSTYATFILTVLVPFQCFLTSKPIRI